MPTNGDVMVGGFIMMAVPVLQSMVKWLHKVGEGNLGRAITPSRHCLFKQGVLNHYFD